MLLGSSEMACDDENRNRRGGSPQSHPSSPGAAVAGTGAKGGKGWLSYLPPEIQVLVAKWRNGPKHTLCHHRYGCIPSIVEGSARLFAGGFCVQALIKIVGQIGKVVRQPSHLITLLKHSDNYKLGAFLGTFVGVFKAVNCCLRWLRSDDHPLHGLLAGFLAGWSMMFYKSSTAALYLASKLAEVLYFKGIAAGIVPYIKCADLIIYSLSTALVFHAAVFEPHNLRQAYWKFLLRITNNRFAGMNRHLLVDYGTKATTMYPNFWPKYNPKFTNLPTKLPV